jgi:hypothetical protein
MKKLVLTILISIFVLSLSAQTILNGDFENNTAGDCQYNLSNSEFNDFMQNSFAFGTNDEIDIQDTTCDYGKAAHGRWFISLATNKSDFTIDGMSLSLDKSFISGKSYHLSYYEKSDTTWGDHHRDSLYIGISTDSSKFGTKIYSSEPPTQTDWVYRNFTFTAPITAKYLTMQNKGGKDGWNFVDDFQILSTGISERNSDPVINIFPNPTKGKFTVSIPLAVKQIQIYNSFGKMLYSDNTKRQSKMNYELGKSGVYFIKFIADELITTRKIVVNN